MLDMNSIKLTSFSHGAGCGCKIAPSILETILSVGKQNGVQIDPNLLVGNSTKDDAAVYDLGNGEAVVTTTDFFMPIVDDPFDFGKIAAVNALSDVYAMGGKPLVAIAILGWPIDKIAPEVAGVVLDGARSACKEAGIQLAGGHSIDTAEPIFGLAVTGKVDVEHLKKNSSAKEGSSLYLTKPLGVGIIATAQKRGIVSTEDMQRAVDSMTKLNSLGELFGGLEYVNAMTDVTGFGLLGHLVEMCEGSSVSAEIEKSKIPILPNIQSYLDQKAIPGGTKRNWKSYGHKIGATDENDWVILADPQTSGGLLVSVDPGSESEFENVCLDAGLNIEPIGSVIESREPVVLVR
jgi:selenide, water dikinase